jgi:GLPGLI family protein
MKKLIFLIAMLMLVGVYSQGQVAIFSTPRSQKPVKNEVIDTGVIRVFYELVSVLDPEKPESTNKDYMVLEIGEKGISRFYSDNRRRQDSILTELIQKNLSRIDISKALKDNGVSSGGGDQREVFKNYPSGKILVTDKIVMNEYLCEEGMNEIQWQIGTDTMTVLSYLCQKATTDFRGRHYEAWFAPDLPINNGPWKFGGLPGLILAIEDAAKNYSFQAVGIENTTLPIYFPKKNYIKASRTEIAKINKQMNDDPIGYLTNSMPGTQITVKTVDRSGNEMNPNDIKRPYNPIELE